MGMIGLFILFGIVVFIGVTVMGWDNFLELLEGLWLKFYDFIADGWMEIQERVG